MKASHYCTIFIVVSAFLAGVFSIFTQNWGELGMAISAFAGWSIVAKQEYDERKANETLSR
jgi:hypothetical protein